MANEGIMAAPMPMQRQQQRPQGYVSSLDAYNAASSAMQETDPQAFGEYKTAIGSTLSGLNLKSSEIESFVTLLEYMLQYPDQYKEIIRAGIEAGAIEEGDFPPEFDQGFISTMLAALNEQRIQQVQNVSPEAMGPGPQEPMAMKSGGLADAAKALQAKGRGKDTILAHITPQEAEMLRKAGGLGTINPYTGLREYGWLKDRWNDVKGAAKSIGNAVKEVVKSPIGKIAVSIGLTMALGPLAAGFGIGTAGTAAIVGGGMAALGGGSVQDILKGAAFGYLGGAIAPSISGYMPGAAGSVLNQGFTGAALGTGFGLASGMSPEQALKAGAIGGLTGAGVAYGQQQGYLPGGAPRAAEAPADTTAGTSDLSLAPIEGTGGVGTATENLTPVMRQDALSGQQFSVGMDGKEYLVYKDAAGNNQYVRADPVNPSQPMAPSAPSGDLSGMGKYSPYYTEPTAASMDARQMLLNQTYGDFQNTVPINSSYTAQDPSLVNDYSLQARPIPGPGQVMSSGTGLGIQPPQPVSLSGFNAAPGGIGLSSAGASTAPGLTLPTQRTDFVPVEDRSVMSTGPLESRGPAPVEDRSSYSLGARGEQVLSPVKDFYNENFATDRPSIQAGNAQAEVAGGKAVAAYRARMEAAGSKPGDPGYAAGAEAAYDAAYQANAPGFFSKYAPLAAAGLGATYLAGGFDAPPADDKPVYDPAYTGTDYMRDNPQAFSGSLYNYQSQGAGAYDPARATTYEGGLGAAAPGVVTPTGIMQAQYSPEYGRRRTQALQQYLYSPFIGTAEPIMAAKGGSIREFPRKTGPINGPGTGTSDDIPAMLSDGEFVFTAKAVRNAGGGSRRKGAARMYKLMKSLEKGGMVKG